MKLHQDNVLSVGSDVCDETVVVLGNIVDGNTDTDGVYVVGKPVDFSVGPWLEGPWVGPIVAVRDI